MKRINNNVLLLLTSLSLLIVSCQQNREKKEVEKIIREWVGKTILFPDNVDCFSIGKDSICPNPMDKTYKVLFYSDSIGCASCKLQLYKWTELITESDSVMQGQLKFLFFFQPKNEKEMNLLLKLESFTHPVYLDIENKFNKLNHFPTNPFYHCFLLDGDNKVILVGNPCLKLSVWNLYKKVIIGERL